MKVYAILMIFVMMFSIASFALAESGSSNNETDDSDLNETDDSGNDSESDLNDSDEDRNETELDDDSDSNETEDDSDKNESERERLRVEFKEDRDELREEYRYEYRNSTNKSDRYEIRMKFREDGRELREEYKIKIRGENVTFNYTEDDRLEFMVNKINARTGLNLTVEDLENVTLGQILRAYLSNGRWAEVKVMPDTASERALERLGAKCEERNCTIELKEVGNNRTNSTKLVYEVETEKESRMFGVFKNKMKVRAEVDAETGEVIFTKKPWWAFLASEKDESEDESDDDDDSDDDNNQTITNSSN